MGFDVSIGGGDDLWSGSDSSGGAVVADVDSGCNDRAGNDDRPGSRGRCSYGSLVI